VVAQADVFRSKKNNAITFNNFFIPKNYLIASLKIDTLRR
jgi:hypothetical protein